MFQPGDQMGPVGAEHKHNDRFKLGDQVRPELGHFYLVTEMTWQLVLVTELKTAI